MPHNEELEKQLRQVAHRFHASFPQPPALITRISTGPSRDPATGRKRASPMLAELALSALVLLSVAALAVAIAWARGIWPAHSQPSIPVSPPGTAVPHIVYPAQDLAAAGLTNAAALITPENQPGQHGGEGITLIGAYADPARTVLIFRLGQLVALADVELYDSRGLINGSTSGGPAAPGDAVFVVNLGPHLSADGLAHLTATMGEPPDFNSVPKGTGAFSVALKIQTATPLSAPTHFVLGSWDVTMEKLEATPAVIHLQAVLRGVTADQIQTSTASVLDSSGQLLQPLAESAGITVPKQQMTAADASTIRIDYQWARPAVGGTYQLRLQAPGGTRTITFNLVPS